MNTTAERVKAQHTKGLLHIDVHGNIIGEGKLVAFPGSADGQPQEANARRIVACWNACQRFETDLLERVSRPGCYGIHPAPQDRIDELLAALETARKLLKMTSVYTSGEMSDIDAAIAKVKGGAA